MQASRRKSFEEIVASDSEKGDDPKEESWGLASQRDQRPFPLARGVCEKALSGKAAFKKLRAQWQ
eukprot:3769755-Prorocentrum_lima.AAC.1